MELKEKVKPIPNTNYIQLFDPKTTRITKIKVPLKKKSMDILLSLMDVDIY